MGYLTKYSLELQGDVNHKEEVHGEDAHGNPMTIYRTVVLDQEKIEREIGNLSGYNYPFENMIKWYEHEADMRKFSKRYPNVLFIVSGEGEEGGDLWKKYFKDGKMQCAVAKIVYDDFDPDKLK